VELGDGVIIAIAKQDQVQTRTVSIWFPMGQMDLESLLIETK
jgi:hypothetical protein